LTKFDEVLENDYDNEPKDYNKETILAKALSSVSASQVKKRGPKSKAPVVVKENVTIGQKRKVVDEVVKVSSNNKRAKALEFNGFMRKWIACDDPTRASPISTEVLRCLVSEFKNHGVTGHEIYEVQESVAKLLKERIINNQGDELQLLETSENSNKICQMPLDLHETLMDMFDDDMEASSQHKASRIATSLGSECFNKIRDTQTHAHISLVAAKRETTRAMKFHWETAATSLRVSLHNLKKVSIVDVPEGANRLVNPFSSSGSKSEDKANFEQWRWLTSTDSTSTDMESFDHAGIHPRSMYYHKVAAKDCLHNSIPPVTEETNPAGAPTINLDPIPEHLAVPFQKVSEIMKKDYGIIIIDKDVDINDGITTMNDAENSKKIVHHRADLIYDILKRQLFGEMQRVEGKRNAYEERWGPVLIVVKDNHLKIW